MAPNPLLIDQNLSLVLSKKMLEKLAQRQAFDGFNAVRQVMAKPSLKSQITSQILAVYSNISSQVLTFFVGTFSILKNFRSKK